MNRFEKPENERWSNSFFSCKGGANAGQKAGFCVMLKYFEIKKAFRYYIKQIDFTLPYVWISKRSQKTSKCGKNISETLGYASCATFLFLPHFDVICDLLLNRPTATWNLFVKSLTRRAHILVSANHRMERFRKNDPWVIFNKITSSSITLSEGNHHGFRICLANERYFNIKSFSGEFARFSAIYISLTGLIQSLSGLCYPQKGLNISHNGLFFPHLELI